MWMGGFWMVQKPFYVMSFSGEACKNMIFCCLFTTADQKLDCHLHKMPHPHPFVNIFPWINWLKVQVAETRLSEISNAGWKSVKQHFSVLTLKHSFKSKSFHVSDTDQKRNSSSIKSS